MNYRKIPQSVADKLKPLEAYVYLVLASKSDFKTYESNVNEDILAETAGLCRKTISKHVNNLDKLRIIKKITERRKGDSGAFLFNRYQLFTENYKLISMDLLKEPIKRELIGFLVQLKLRCYNFSNNCKYSIRELADTLAYSSSTVGRYIKEAEDLGYIKRDKEGITLLNSNLFIIDKKSEYELIREFYPEVLTDVEIVNHKFMGDIIR